jgi:hypothetical protein
MTGPRLVLGAVLGLAALALMAEELRLIPLRSRPAHEIIPLVRPLLGPNDALSGNGFQLIVRASPARLREIETLLAQIDVAARQWTLTVRQAVVNEREDSRYAASGEARVGENIRIIATGRPSPASGGSVEVSGPAGRARIEGERISTTARDEHRQILRVQDGQRAYIRAGQAVPRVKSVLTVTQTRAILAQGVELTDIITGFDVLPRAQGDRVHLEITPRLSSLADPAHALVSFHELRTTVTVKPGEWVDLGLLGGSGETVRRAFVEGSATREGERRTILIRID